MEGFSSSMPWQHKEIKALVADDDDEFRTALAAIIAVEGWEVLQARDGEEALGYARTHRPNVLLLDQRMPALTGTEVVQRLRADGLDIPTVLISAAHEIAELAASVGVAHYLRKPFGLDELTEMLSRAAQGFC